MASNGSQLEAGNDSLHDDKCTLCEEEGQQVEATKFCKECCVFMCDSCVEIKHNKFPLNKRHQMLNQKQFSAVKEASFQSFPTRRCLKHPGELLNMFCGDHDVVCCLVCKALEHSTCAKSQHLFDAAKGTQVKGYKYQSVHKDIKAFISDVKKILHDRRTDITRVAAAKHTIKNTIADFRKRQDKYFNDLEKNALEKLQQKENTIVSDIEQDTKYLDDTETEAGNILQHLESFKGNNECELFVLIKEAQQMLINARDKVRTISRSVNKSSIYYELDPRIEEYLKSLEALGSFTDAPVSICPVPDKSSKADIQADGPNQLIVEAHDSENQFEMCALPDGKILCTVITDQYMHTYSNALKRYSKSNKPIDSVQVPGKIVAVCVVEDSQVAVLYNTKVSRLTNQLVSSQNEMQQYQQDFEEDEEDYRPHNQQNNQQHSQQINQQHFRQRFEEDYQQHFLQNNPQHFQQNNPQHFQQNNQPHFQQRFQEYNQQHFPQNNQPHYEQDYQQDNNEPETLNVGVVGFVSLGKSMILNKGFSIGSSASGMGYYDGKLYVCCKEVNYNPYENHHSKSENPFVTYKGHYDKSYIAVYGIDGKLQRYIPDAPQSFLYELGNIAVSEDGQYVLVFNKSKDVILMLDMSGNIVESLSNTNGAFCTDDRGNVFACMKNNTVVQMSLKRHDTNVMLKDRTKSPKAISFDKKHSRLLVASYESKSPIQKRLTENPNYRKIPAEPEYISKTGCTPTHNYIVHVFKL